MEAELPRLRISPGRVTPCPCSTVLVPMPWDETEPLRRRVLLVCTAATLVGVWGRALRAAAAAADESDNVGLDSRRWKAEMAAEVALGLAVDTVRGCIAVVLVSYSVWGRSYCEVDNM